MLWRGSVYIAGSILINDITVHSIALSSVLISAALPNLVEGTVLNLVFSPHLLTIDLGLSLLNYLTIADSVIRL